MQQYLKALYGAAVAALAATSAAYAEGHGHIGVQAGIVIASSALAALSVIWAVPNTLPASSNKTVAKP